MKGDTCIGLTLLMVCLFSFGVMVYEYDGVKVKKGIGMLVR